MIAAREEAPLVLFDGVCHLCNATVQWIVRRDRHARFRFAPLQSAAARTALAAAGAPTDVLESLVLIDAAGVHVRSDAVLRIAGGLGFPWSLAAAALIVPRGLRDPFYVWVARHRYDWFGRRDTCMVPTPDMASRFIEASTPDAGTVDTIQTTGTAPSDKTAGSFAGSSRSR